MVDNPADDRHDRDASFYSSFEVTDSEYRRAAPGVFQVRSVTIDIKVDGDRWVRRGRQSPSLLAHEQGHFDITGLAAHNASRTILRLRADSAESLREKGKQAVRNQVAISDRWNREYDDATNHGLDRRAQQRWSDRIARAIEADHASLDDVPDGSKPAEAGRPEPKKSAPNRLKGR